MMGVESFTIIALSLVATKILSLFGPVRYWLSGFSLTRNGSILLCVLFFATFFLGGVRDSMSDPLIDPLRIARIVVFVAITGLAALDFIYIRSSKAPLNAPLLFMFAYGGFAMLTAAWSLNPLLTLWKGFEVITHVAVAAVIIRRIVSIDDALDMLGMIWIFLVFIAVSLIAAAVIAPDAAFTYTQRGIASLHGVAFTVNSNTGTQIGALVMLAGASLALVPPPRSKKWIIIALIVLGFAAILLTRSRTSIFAATAALMIVAVASRKPWLMALILVSAVLFAAFDVGSDFITQFVLRGQTEEEFTGMSGRIYLWTSVWSVFIERPIFGYGFYAGIREIYGAPGADNTYLQVLMGGGVSLLAVFLVPVILIATQIFRTRPPQSMMTTDRSYVLLWMQTASLFTVLVVRSTTGPSFDAHHINLILFLLCSVAASTLARFRRVRPAVSRSRSHRKTQYHDEIASARPVQR